MSKKSIEEIAAIIEADAGQSIDGLREALVEVEAGVPNGRVTTAEQITIRAARNKSGLSQSKFAELINTPARTLQEWEQGRAAPPGVAVKLCELLLSHPELAA